MQRDRTSRQGSPAIARPPIRPKCNGRRRHQPCRSPNERRRRTRTTDEAYTEAPYKRSYGRSRTSLYNERRPHQALAARSPMAVWREATAGVNGCGHDGQRFRVAHRPTAATADAASSLRDRKEHRAVGLPTRKLIPAVPLRGSTSNRRPPAPPTRSSPSFQRQSPTSSYLSSFAPSIKRCGRSPT